MVFDFQSVAVVSLKWQLIMKKCLHYNEYGAYLRPT